MNVQHAEAIIRDVGQEEIMSRYGKLNGEDIRQKAGPDADNPVTAADEAAENALRERLTALVPGSIAVGEEACSRDPSLIKNVITEESVWVIDPLDGTKDFREKGSAFTIIVALLRRGEIVAGFSHHPPTGETLIAEHGGGAWLDGRRLKVPSSVPLTEARGSIGRRVWQEPQMREEVMGNFASLECNPNSGLAAQRLLTSGSYFGQAEQDRLHFRACPYWSTPWDDAAPLLAYAEAGGVYSNWHGGGYKLDQLYQGILMAPDKAMLEALRQNLAPFNLRNRIMGQTALRPTFHGQEAPDEVN